MIFNIPSETITKKRKCSPNVPPLNPPHHSPFPGPVMAHPWDSTASHTLHCHQALGPKVHSFWSGRKGIARHKWQHMWARYFRQIFRSYNFLPKCLENQHYGEIFLGSWRCLYIFSKLLRYSLICSCCIVFILCRETVFTQHLSDTPSPQGSSSHQTAC